MLGVCQKRALALLARRASEFRKNVSSLFSRFLEGYHLGSAVVRARVFALPSGSTKVLLVPGANSHFEISICLARRVSRPCQKGGPCQPNFPNALVSDVLLSGRVFA